MRDFFAEYGKFIIAVVSAALLFCSINLFLDENSGFKAVSQSIISAITGADSHYIESLE